jgi:AcrR family transcriptional regulator
MQSQDAGEAFMIANETGSGAQEPGRDDSRNRADRRAHAIDDRAARALTRIEERMQKVLAAHEEREQRARERFEERLQRARAAQDDQSQRVRNGRERILRAAKELVVENGYIPTSLQEIADAAQLRKASIYHHVKDKEALFSGIVQDEIAKSTEHLREVVERNGPLSAALFDLAVSQLEMSQTDAGRLFMDFQKNVPEDRHEEIHAMLQRWVDEFAVLFDRAIQREEIAPIDPRVAALFFFHMGAAWTFHGMEDPSILPPDPETGARTLVNVLIHGLAGGLPPQD